MACPNIRLTKKCPIYLNYTEDILNVWLADRYILPMHATSIDGAQSWVLMRKKCYTSTPVPVSSIITTFESHLKTLQEWEQTMIQNTECHEPIHYIAQLMVRPTISILVANYVSVFKQKNTMSFGWVISLLNSTILATQSGPAYGHASLFCAEGNGLLSVTRFLYQLQRYTQLTLACNVSIYIDNKGVVTRATNQIKYEYDYPYNTLEHDWDIIAQSAQYLWMLGSKLKVAHIKSHQDDNCDFDQLDLQAQLNVQANKLATAY
eukprot:11507607-Ditylum_brightwellii.AAC.1